MIVNLQYGVTLVTWFGDHVVVQYESSRLQTVFDR